mmetsp:Transcript_35824/g.65723  ORF Transcript_35824/g.65723 Transcript_35824/m.65723 type:complete len:688 (-) Transcript_35824:52-2115(-)
MGINNANVETTTLVTKDVVYGTIEDGDSVSTAASYANGPKGSPEEVADARAHLPELTAKAILLGCLLAIILGAANAYLGLKVGMTVSASIPASVMSMVVLSFFDSHTILENNQVQTCAASGPSVAAGAIFTIPALLISGYWESFHYFSTMGIILVGGVLGIMCTIPLRRALVVGSNLRFPEGVATATVLEAGARSGDRSSDMWALASSSLYGAVAKLMGQGFGLWTESGCSTAWYIGKSVFWVGTDVSVALVGVGYIVGLNICCLCFMGGLINWWIAIPLEVQLNHNSYRDAFGEQPAAEFAAGIWSAKTRYLGVGAMTVGGLWALVSLRKELAAGVAAALQGMSRPSSEQASGPQFQRMGDLPRSVVLPLIVTSSAGFLFAAVIVTRWYAAAVAGPLMLAATFLFSAVAAYMAGLVGSSNNPISGITLSSILVVSLLLCTLVGHEDSAQGVMAAIVIGSMVCCAAAIGGDNMQDLKCGRLVGATPWKQQTSQLAGVLSSAIVIPLVLQLLHTAYGFEGAPGSSAHSQPLAAPQAGLMRAVAQGVFERSLPWFWVGLGVALAILCILLDEWLRSCECAWRCPVLAVAVGVYLPWSLTVPMVLGGIIAELQQRMRPEDSGHRGLLLSSGLITGEALAGIALAIPVAAMGREDALYLVSAGMPWLGLTVLLLAAVGLGYGVLAASKSET